MHPTEAASPPHCHSATDNLPSRVDSPSTPSDDAAPAHPTQSTPVIFTIIEPALTTGVSDISRAMIISLLVIANLIQVSFIKVIQSIARPAIQVILFHLI
jgi:hypothetical protein